MSFELRGGTIVFMFSDVFTQIPDSFKQELKNNYNLNFFVSSPKIDIVNKNMKMYSTTDNKNKLVLSELTIELTLDKSYFERLLSNLDLIFDCLYKNFTDKANIINIGVISDLFSISTTDNINSLLPVINKIIYLTENSNKLNISNFTEFRLRYNDPVTIDTYKFNKISEIILSEKITPPDKPGIYYMLDINDKKIESNISIDRVLKLKTLILTEQEKICNF